MAFITYAVAELSDPLKIESTVIAYAELQLGMQRNTRYGQHKERVRLGLQTSPENFFYDETAFAGAPYVNLNALEFTALAGTPKLWPTTLRRWRSDVGNRRREEDPDNPNTLLPDSETCKSKLKVNLRCSSRSRSAKATPTRCATLLAILWKPPSTRSTCH